MLSLTAVEETGPRLNEQPIASNSGSELENVRSKCNPSVPVGKCEKRGPL